MATFINDVVSKITSEIPISEVISKFINIQKKGRNFVAVCPFHNDSDPSLSINDEKQIYKCFSCGEAGNSFVFVENYENVSFKEAVYKICKLFNIKIDLVDSEFTPKNQFNEEQLKIFKINETANAYFQSVLHSKFGSEAKEYLLSRNMDANTIIDFDIGLALSEASLVTHLVKKGFSESEIILAGLGYLANNKIKDFFVNRIIFPIKNSEGHVAAFSGRVFNPTASKLEKYLNTKETVVFRKSEILFNLNKSAKEIKRNKEVVLLEGYMDTISLFEKGIINAVAIMGTSISENQIFQIKKITSKVTIFLDGDEPGVNASLNIATAFLAKNFIVNIVYNETQLDPDELVKQKGVEFVKKLIAEAQHPLNFALNYFAKKNDLQNLNNFKDLLKKISSLVKVTNEQILLAKFFKNLADISGVEVETIKQEFSDLKPKSSVNLVIPHLNPADLPQNTQPRVLNVSELNFKAKKKYLNAEKRLIFAAFNQMIELETFKQYVILFNFEHHQKLAKALIKIMEDNQTPGLTVEKFKNIVFNEKPELWVELNKIIAEFAYLKIDSLNENFVKDCVDIIEMYKIEESIQLQFLKLNDLPTSETELIENSKPILEIIEGLRVKKK